MQEERICNNCGSWIDRGGNKLGWCVSDKIARGFDEFDEDNFMCQAENIRTQMDDTYIITGRSFGCVHFKDKQ